MGSGAGAGGAGASGAGAAGGWSAWFGISGRSIPERIRTWSARHARRLIWDKYLDS